jgi:hypothetical protein
MSGSAPRAMAARATGRRNQRAYGSSTTRRLGGCVCSWARIGQTASAVRLGRLRSATLLARRAAVRKPRLRAWRPWRPWRFRLRRQGDRSPDGPLGVRRVAAIQPAPHLPINRGACQGTANGSVRHQRAGPSGVRACGAAAARSARAGRRAGAVESTKSTSADETLGSLAVQVMAHPREDLQAAAGDVSGAPRCRGSPG